MRWPWQRSGERKTHIRVPSVEGALHPPRVVAQDYIRVNNHGQQRTHICADCESPYFNDYQWNARLLRPVTCEKCGVTVAPLNQKQES